MKVCHGLTYVPQGQTAVALGVFDGVHQGHRTLLWECVRRAKLHDCTSVCVTFAPHPQAVLSSIPFQTLMTVPQRLAQLAMCDIDVTCLVPFTKALSEQPADVFLEGLCRALHPAYLVVGYDFTFGQGGQGDTRFLQRMEAAYGYRLFVLPQQMVDSQPVSATAVKQCLRNGEVEHAEHLLGHPFSIVGTVCHGKGVGRQLHYPTANVTLKPTQFLPKFGVYAAFVLTKDKACHPAVLNLGRHPTLPEGGLTLEVHLLDGACKLYDQCIHVTFVSFLRPEQTFADAEALKVQIALDVNRARGICSQHLDD